MSPKAIKERLETMSEFWLLSVKLMNSKKIKNNLSISVAMKYKTEELTGYLYDYCSDLLTDEEKAAYKNTLILKKTENWESPKAKEILMREEFSSDEKVLDLLKDGEGEFFKKIEQRVLRENPKKEFMNLCPKCDYLAKTPKAKQCRKCFHSWHEEFEK